MRRLLLAAALLAGCATVPKHAGSDAVPLGEWCAQVGAKFCDAMAGRCMNGMSGFADGCRDSFTPSCVAGRATDAPSGRSYDELGRCVEYIGQQSCEGLGAGLGSGNMQVLCAAQNR